MGAAPLVFLLAMLGSASCFQTSVLPSAFHRDRSFAIRKQTKLYSMCDQSRDYVPKMPIVEIEYCTGCRWMLRGAWLAQELLTTFESDIGTVSLVPSRVRPGGVFDIRLNGKTIWSRKVEGRFPEAKEIKQRVRDIISPEKNLGHSDSAEKKVVEAEFSKDETEKQMDDKTAEEQRRYFGVM